MFKVCWNSLFQAITLCGGVHRTADLNCALDTFPTLNPGVGSSDTTGHFSKSQTYQAPVLILLILFYLWSSGVFKMKEILKKYEEYLKKSIIVLLFSDF